MPMRQGTKQKRVLQALAAGAIMPLLSFCSSGDMAAPKAVATPLASAAPVVAGPPVIYINEVLAHTDEPQVDTLELYNPGASGVDLTGWCISDNKDDVRKYCVPAPSGNAQQPVIKADGYFLLTSAELGFAFSEFGEEIILSAPDNGVLKLIDRVEFGVSPNGVSLGRYVTSTGQVDFPLQSKLTLGAPNAGPLVPPVVISEIAYHPIKGPEYLVLTNSSAQVVPLFDPAVAADSWQVAGIGDNGGPFVLPLQTSLQPHESVVLTADPAGFHATYPILQQRVFGPFDGKLNNDGERIVLQAPQPPELNGDVAFADMDVIDYGVSAPWPVVDSGQPLVRRDLHQYGNDPANWRAAPSGLQALSLLVLPLIRR
ncbi:MAG: lamin tail domain-containing protein [Caldilineaceae bacterium]